MKELVDDIVKTLRGKGLKVTPQRFAVYANLLSRQDHPTAEQILLDLNKQAPISSQATVYSALQALRDVGLVREVLLEAGVSRYDANVKKHHHFYCRECKTIEDIPWEAFPDVSLDKLRPGLKAQTYEVTVYGTCNCDIEH